VAKYLVGEAADIPPGSRKLVRVLGREIGVFNVDGRFDAVRNRCAHQGGPLCKGTLLGHLTSPRPGSFEFDPGRKLLECPWHGWEYDLETGQSWFDPAATRVRRYDVGVEPGSALDIDPDTGLARGPYVIETYPVAVDREYVVVEVGA
jgi:3-phenylpropionate/trans-cinnamate dioxygenase ferredoxin subunit